MKYIVSFRHRQGGDVRTSFLELGLSSTDHWPRIDTTTSSTSKSSRCRGWHVPGVMPIYCFEHPRIEMLAVLVLLVLLWALRGSAVCRLVFWCCGSVTCTEAQMYTCCSQSILSLPVNMYVRFQGGALGIQRVSCQLFMSDCTDPALANHACFLCSFSTVSPSSGHVPPNVRYRLCPAEERAASMR